MAYINLQTSGLLTLDIAPLESKWDSYGYPEISLSGQIIPNDVLVQQMLNPSGLV